MLHPNLFGQSNRSSQYNLGQLSDSGTYLLEIISEIRYVVMKNNIDPINAVKAILSPNFQVN